MHFWGRDFIKIYFHEGKYGFEEGTLWKYIFGKGTSWKYIFREEIYFHEDNTVPGKGLYGNTFSGKEIYFGPTTVSGETSRGQQTNSLVI